MSISLNGKMARVKRSIRNTAGEEIRRGDIVRIACHKQRAGTVTIYRPKAGISGVALDDLEVIESPVQLSGD